MMCKHVFEQLSRSVLLLCQGTLQTLAGMEALSSLSQCCKKMRMCSPVHMLRCMYYTRKSISKALCCTCSGARIVPGDLQPDWVWSAGS